MYKQRVKTIAMLALFFGIAGTSVVASQEAFGGDEETDLLFVRDTLIAKDSPQFGDGKIGSYFIQVRPDNPQTRVWIEMLPRPAEGASYQIWLIDNDTGKKERVGILDEREKRGIVYNNVGNPFKYDRILVTESLAGSTDYIPIGEDSIFADKESKMWES